MFDAVRGLPCHPPSSVTAVDKSLRRYVAGIGCGLATARGCLVCDLIVVTAAFVQVAAGTAARDALSAKMGLVKTSTAKPAGTLPWTASPVALRWPWRAINRPPCRGCGGAWTAFAHVCVCVWVLVSCASPSCWLDCGARRAHRPRGLLQRRGRGVLHLHRNGRGDGERRQGGDRAGPGAGPVRTLSVLAAAVPTPRCVAVVWSLQHAAPVRAGVSGL
jgi:hypothetical protein